MHNKHDLTGCPAKLYLFLLLVRNHTAQTGDSVWQGQGGSFSYVAWETGKSNDFKNLMVQLLNFLTYLQTLFAFT